MAAAEKTAGWDPRYELKAVALLSVGFGLVGLDRFIIAPLFPFIAEDLGLDYQDMGLISGALALTWGLASLFFGNLSDRIGHRRVLVGTVIVFSTLVAMSGLATGLVSLLVIRAAMGFAEGGFVPASIAATMDASKPNRMGLTVGFQQMAVPFVGLGLGPLIAIGLLKVVPGWESNYLIDHMRLTADEMGFVMSGLGVGGVLGMIFIPAISDRLGRKPVMAACMFIAALALGALAYADAALPGLVLLLFAVSAMISGVVAINIGPLLRESVPLRISATATGIVAGLGEIVGGAIAPALAGAGAEALGIQVIPQVSFIAAVAGFLIVLFGLREPAKRV